MTVLTVLMGEFDTHRLMICSGVDITKENEVVL